MKNAKKHQRYFSQAQTSKLSRMSSQLIITNHKSYSNELKPHNINENVTNDQNNVNSEKLKSHKNKAVHENNAAGKVSMLKKIFENLSSYVMKEISLVTSNLPKDFFVKMTYLYPLQGFIEFLTTPLYWEFLLPMLYPYFLLTTVIGILYYFLIFPIILVNLTMTMGVIGFVIAHIHFFLEANAISLAIAKIILFPSTNAIFFSLVLENHNQQDYLVEAKKQLTSRGAFQNPEKHGSFCKIWKQILEDDIILDLSKDEHDHRYWVHVAPLQILSLFHRMLRFCFLFGLSFIPIVGPILVLCLTSPARAQNCLHEYFVLENYSKDTINNVRRANYGQFLAFGLVAGLLETIPYLSLVFEYSNLNGAALWANDLIEKKKSA